MAAAKAEIVERTPYSLLYKITQNTAQAQASIQIPNTGGATPDLRTDSLNGTALREIVDYARDHGGMNQGSARARLLGDGAPSGPGGNFGSPRAHCKITSRDGSDGWGVDANVIGAQPVLTVFLSQTTSAVAYLRIRRAHSKDT
jgi:hypothetical protein